MIAALLLTIFVVICFHNFYWKRRGLPPGPTPLPLLGNAFSFFSVPHPDFYINWTKKYGDIYTIWVGTWSQVCVNDLEGIQEHFLRDGDTFAGRYLGKEMLEIIKNGQTGILFTEDSLWREHRRFALTVLRDFGVGKNLMEMKILHEITLMFEEMDADVEAGGQLVVMSDHIDVTVGSIVNALLLGHKYRNKDRREQFFKIKRMMNDMFKQMSNPFMVVFQYKTHIFKNVPVIGAVYKNIVKTRDTLMGYFAENVEEKRRTVDLSSSAPPEDYVEAYLRKQKEYTEAGKEHTFDDEQLYGTLWDLWFAGQETTSVTTQWCLAYLLKHPEVQEKLHNELSNIVSPDQIVTSEHRHQLPYLNAVIAETQRCGNMVTNNVTRRTTKETVIHGYKIPAGQPIVSNIASLLYDDRYFPEPHSFKPERFIDENGAFKSHPALLPFGLGKRVCLGEALAKMELFLLIGNMFNRYKFVENLEKPVSLKRVFGSSVNPIPYVCNVERRE
uniref:Unspecific monooxygenase n=1 Tax=Panagrellus redivivus TaxID=6233 RepID=A0A7E4UQX7_PANRE